MELEKLTVYEVYETFKKKQANCVELTNAYLGRIEKLDKKISSFLTINRLEAITQAEKADKLINEEGFVPCWLTGVPFGIKDSLLTKGLRTTAGSKILENFVPPYDAGAVEKLKSVYGVIIGKTNMDEFGMGASTENSAFGVTKNPWDLTRVSGGSSGGSAAAVAADFCAFALGEDTGGSIRQPASFCGVVGLKPTYGRISRYGLIALGSSLDHVGGMTKDVRDAALVLNIIAGYDARDSTSVNKEVPDYTEKIKFGVKGMRIGLPKEYFAEGTETGVKETIKKAVSELQNLGAEIVDLSLPNTPLALPVYYLIMSAEASANLARYDGIRFGGDRSNFGAESRRRIILGTYALSSGYYDAYYLKAAKVRTLIREEFARAFEKVDLIASPVAPTPAFKIGEKIDDPLKMYLSDIYTVPVNLAGLPAISVPCGFANNLPVGLQLIGNHWQEETILRAAFAYEQASNWRKQKPKDL